MNTTRRDTPAMIMAIISTTFLTALITWLFTIGTWWAITIAILAALLALVMVYGIVESAQVVPRDEKGKRL